jgi:hypothetical protein
MHAYMHASASGGGHGCMHWDGARRRVRRSPLSTPHRSKLTAPSPPQPARNRQGARTLGLPIRDYLASLRSAGLGSLPGTAAEILDDEVRSALCPDKISAGEWLEVVRSAHDIGLRSTSTVMFGHLEDGPVAWARHLIALRQLAAETGGITEFVPLPFVHMQAPVFLKGAARRGPTLRECVLMHAVARLALHPFVTNIQASWCVFCSACFCMVCMFLQLCMSACTCQSVHAIQLEPAQLLLQADRLLNLANQPPSSNLQGQDGA